VAKNVSFFVCLSVCLSVTLLNVRVCVTDFAMKAFEYRNDFDTVGQGKVSSFAPVFNFLRSPNRRKLATPQIAEVNKMVTFGVFRCQRATK